MRRGRLAAVVAHRLGARDGLGTIAEQWCRALEAVGFEVVEVAGTFGPDEGSRERRAAPSLWSPDPARAPEEPVADEFARALASVDFAAVVNVWSLASAPRASLALMHEIGTRGLPAVAYHLDLPRQHAARRQDASFPLLPASVHHVALNQMTASDLERRLARPVDVVHPVVDVTALRSADRDVARAGLGIVEREVAVLHPVRLVGRKRIDLAVRLVCALRAELGSPVRYVLTGGSSTLDVDDPMLADLAALRDPPVLGEHADVASMYAAADLVALTSEWEGFGLPVLEAAAAGRMIVTAPYPVLREIHALGLHTLDHRHVAQWARWMGTSRWGELVARNARRSEDFDVTLFPAVVTDLVDRAYSLRGRRADLRRTS